MVSPEFIHSNIQTRSAILETLSSESFSSAYTPYMNTALNMEVISIKHHSGIQLQFSLDRVKPDRL
jgi:hypothetical protein